MRRNAGAPRRGQRGIGRSVEWLEQRTLLDAGALDTQFGVQGKVTSDFAGHDDFAASIALEAGGKIVAAGSSRDSATNTWSFALARYLPDGSLDNQFGVAGRVATPLGMVFDHILDDEGRILVVGTSTTTPTFDFALARYLANGVLDVSFGSNGLVATDFGGSRADTAQSVLIQPDGKIVVSGISRLFPGDPAGELAVARYDADGVLDGGFGTGGKVMVPINATGSLVLQPDGKIVVGGAPAAVRLHADGSLDTSFGSQGVARVDFGDASVSGTALELQADGKLVAVGTAAGDFALSRFHADGSLDADFGVNGKVLTDFSRPARSNSSDNAASIAIQPDGKMIVAGFGFHEADTSIVLARYHADGSLDPWFGEAGLVLSRFEGAIDARDLEVLPDGRIITAGAERAGAGDSDFALVRYLGGTTTASGTINERFVEQLYRDVLRRPVEAAGLAFWTALLEGEASRDQVALAVLDSSEYRGLVVGDLYFRYLDRAPDADGLDSFVSFLAAGGSIEQVRAGILGSDEYFLKSGGGSDLDALVAGLYHDVLLRSPDPTGAAAFRSTLLAGGSRSAVALEVLRSNESRRNEAQDLYHRFLHRSGEPEGLEFFADRLQETPYEELVALIAASEEYLASL